MEQCPNCSESVEEDARMMRCPTCGTQGYDECCFPAGVGTECLECETADDGYSEAEDDDYDFDYDDADVDEE